MRLFVEILKFFKCKHIIPEGMYCYTIEGYDSIKNRPTYKLCPYWGRVHGRRAQEDGFCSYMMKGDWDEGQLGVLWDQCKECEVKFDDKYIDMDRTILRKEKHKLGTFPTFNRCKENLKVEVKEIETKDIDDIPINR